MKAGRIHLVAVNEGRLTHNLVVESITDDPTKEVVYGRTDTAHPGRPSTSATRSRCSPAATGSRARSPTTSDLGQYGTLTVVK